MNDYTDKKWMKDFKFSFVSVLQNGGQYDGFLAAKHTTRLKIDNPRNSFIV